MPDTDRHVRPFAEWLHDQRGGQTHAELSDAFNELIAAVAEYGKAGSLTFTVKVGPGGTDVTTVVVSDDIVLKAPRGSRPQSVFFVDASRNLTRNNPMQSPLPLREVPRSGDAEMREAK